jgi:septum formation protein
VRVTGTAPPYIGERHRLKEGALPTLVLASTSPWRRQLLEAVGLRVEGADPGVDESEIVGATPEETAALRAAAKADAVAARHPGRWVLGADQVGILDGETLGKPADPDDHLRRLRALAGRSHVLVTAWSLRGPGGAVDGAARTVLTARDDLTDAELSAYVATGEGAGCAGGYAIEGRGGALFRRVDGDWFNVVGLPLLDVLDALRRAGFRPLESR